MNLIYYSACGTDRGSERANNEDSCCIDDFSFRSSSPFDDGGDTGPSGYHSCVSIDQSIYAVCDGMGGCGYGEIASAITAAEVNIAYDRLSALGDYACSEINRLILNAMLNSANCSVSKQAEALGISAMGTTCSVLYIRDSEIQMSSIGDSRIYRMREGELLQLSKDDTQYEDFASLGLADESCIDMLKNRLTTYIGMRSGNTERIDFPIFSDTALAGDIYLLCSDGLTDMLDDSSISSILSEVTDGKDVSGAVEKLIASALAAGGRDNVTAVLVLVSEEPVFRSEATAEDYEFADWDSVSTGH